MDLPSNSIWVYVLFLIFIAVSPRPKSFRHYDLTLCFVLLPDKYEILSRNERVEFESTTFPPTVTRFAAAQRRPQQAI